MKFVRAALGGNRDLHRTRVGLLDAEGVGLNRDFFDRFDIRSDIGPTLNDVARHVQAVQRVQVAAGVAAVAAGLDGDLRIEVVRRAGCASPGQQSVSSDAGSDGGQAQHVAGPEGQVIQSFFLDGRLQARIGSVQDRRLRRNHDTFGCGLDIKLRIGFADLVREQVHGDHHCRETISFDAHFVLAGAQAGESIDSGGASLGLALDPCRLVGEQHASAGNHSTGLVDDGSLDAAAELGEAHRGKQQKPSKQREKARFEAHAYPSGRNPSPVESSSPPYDGKV